MADTKISALTAIDAVASGDEFPANDVSAVVTKKVTAAQLATYVNTTTGAAVSAMSAASALDGTELFYTVQGGNDRKATGDQIQALCVSDTAYANSWNGVTDQAPSQNAVRDKFETQRPTPVTTAWVLSVDNVSGNANSSNSATDTIYYVPVWIPTRRTLSDLGLFVVTGAAGNVKIGIYANSASNTPTGNVLAATGSISVSSSGVAVSGDIAGADVTFEPGFYWFAHWYDVANCVVTTLNTASISSFMGSTTLTNVLNTSAGQYVYTSAETYGTFPDATSETLTLVPRGSGIRSAIFAMKVV